MTDEAARLRELLDISRAIASTTDYDECLRLVVQKTCALVNAEACLLLLAEPGRPAALGAYVGLPHEVVRDLHVVLDEHLVSTLRARLGIGPEHVVVAVPMILHGDVRGSLAVMQRPEREGRRAAAERDEALLSALADQAALALGHKAHLEELERALAALADERRWLDAVIEHSPAAVLLVKGTTGGRVTANAVAEELFGRPIRDGAGTAQYADQICTPDGTPVPQAAIPSMEALRGKVVRRELAIRHPDGRLIPVLASAGAIPDERGGTLGAVVLYDDISVLKALDRLREEWTSVIAHDLRQPVNAISMRAQMLGRESGTTDPEVGKAVQHIVKSARNLSRMIDDLLDSSLLEAQRLVLVRERHDVSALLDEAIGRSTAAMTGHTVTLHVAEDVPAVDVDAGRVEQVLMNLLANASRYGAHDRPIEVRAERDGGSVSICVQNQGPPIDPSLTPHLFERFRRGSRGEGLGLGLYITKGIVEAHGGTIWVESTPEGRTTFSFTLPAAPDPPSAIRSRTPASKRPPRAPRGSRAS